VVSDVAPRDLEPDRPVALVDELGFLQCACAKRPFSIKRDHDA
jgi:hypothetical protein